MTFNVAVTSPSGITKFLYVGANTLAKLNSNIKRIDKYGLDAVEIRFDAKFKNESSYQAAMKKPIRLAGIDLDWYVKGSVGSYDDVYISLNPTKN
jgi:hypothetical protein